MVVRLAMASSSIQSSVAVSVIAKADIKGRGHASYCCSSTTLSSIRFKPREREVSKFQNDRRVVLKGAIKAKKSKEEASLAPALTTSIKHLLMPVIDPNPYLSQGTRQAAATTTSLANKYGADITVVVIDEEKRESSSKHQTQVSNIRWHLAEGGFEEFKLLERLGEGKKATAVIGEVADDLGTDLVVMSMEAIHSKFIDANLLAEFIPCPVLLLPL